ncbi:actin-binding protein WASF1-like [Acomys russatus]|uniref:actin-binding protein WASF1-like n=1 Tax=Acomys russatus TaxID=60746 RepID=UPI0021E31D9F|nr:actin-binding protein WASF1-like [Acomys russatus]
MSFNGEKFKQLNESGTVTETKDEFIYVIVTTCNKIARRINDLDKLAEDLFRKLDREIHRISFKLKILQENIIRLADATHKVPKKVLSMQVWKSRKTISNVTIKTEQIYSCTPSPINVFERNNANIPVPLFTVPGYYQNDREDSKSSDRSFHSCLYSSKIFKGNISVSEEQTSDRHLHLQNKDLDHASKPKNILECHQSMEEHISVHHIAASCKALSHSYLDQSDGGSSFCAFPLNEGNLEGKSSASMLPRAKEHLHYHIGRMSSLRRPRVIYGTGKGDVVPIQQPPLIHHKTPVFVNPLAPEAPPLPSDCLIQLTSSKGPPSAHGVQSSISSPRTSFVLQTTTTTTLTSACLKTNPKKALMMPPEVEFTSTSNSLECYELQPDYLNPQGQDQKIPPLLYPSVIPLSNHPGDSLVDLMDSALVVQPQKNLSCQPIKSSSPKSPKCAKSSLQSPSTSRFACGLLPQNPVANTSQSSSAHSRSSMTPCPSLSVSTSSNQKPQEISKCYVSHLAKLIEERSRLPTTNPKQQLHPPQTKLSSFTSTKVTTLQTSSSMKSQSISCHSTLAISQYAIGPTYASIMQNPAFLPIMTKPRKALMEAVRKAATLRNTEEIIPRTENAMSNREAEMIRIRRKAMGYNSGKSESETESVE